MANILLQQLVPKLAPRLTMDGFKLALQGVKKGDLLFHGTRGPGGRASSWAYAGVDVSKVPMSRPTALELDRASKTSAEDCTDILHLTTEFDTAAHFGATAVNVIRRGGIETALTECPNKGLGEWGVKGGVSPEHIVGYVDATDFEAAKRIWDALFPKPKTSALERYGHLVRK